MELNISNNILHQKSANIERALRLIEKSLKKSLTLDEVAKECGISKFYFSRIFKASTGLSFKKYLIRKRIAAAKILLANNNTSITEISFSVGFNDLPYFDRTFRKMESITPSAYREMLQNNGGAEKAG